MDISAVVVLDETTLQATVDQSPGEGGGSLTVQDEGSTLSAAVTSINFTGAGVTATGTSSVTVNVPAGSGGNVSNSGTPTSGQAAEWISSTVVQGVAVTGNGSYVKSTSPTLVTPTLGTPTSGTLTNCTGLPAAGVTGLGSLATQSGTFSGTSSGTNTGDNAVNSLYSGLVSNANHTGDATGSTALTLATVNSNVGSFGSATVAPIFTVNGKGLITAVTSATITPSVGSITGLGTGVATALAINTGTAGAPVLFGGALGTPSSATLTNATGLPLTTGVTGILAVAKGGTGTASPGLVQGANVTITGSWPNQTISATGAASGAITGSGLTLATNRLVGRGTAGTGAPEEITPAGGLVLVGDVLVPGEIVKLVVSNVGEAGITVGNFKSEVRLDRAFVVVGVWWNCHPTAMGSAGTSDARPYIRTGAGTTSAGTKTNLLTSASNIASLAASVHTVDATSSISGGTYSGAAGDWLGVDLMSLGTGSSGHFLTFILRYS